MVDLFDMRLVILPSYDDASTWAAKYIKARINEFKPGPEKHFVLGLPTGTIIMRGLLCRRLSSVDMRVYISRRSANGRLCETMQAHVAANVSRVLVCTVSVCCV